LILFCKIHVGVVFANRFFYEKVSIDHFKTCSNYLKQAPLSFKKQHKIKARNWIRNPGRWKRGYQ